MEVLERNNWNRQASAEELGINRTTLYKKMKRLGLEDARFCTAVIVRTQNLDSPSPGMMLGLFYCAVIDYLAESSRKIRFKYTFN